MRGLNTEKVKKALSDNWQGIEWLNKFIYIDEVPTEYHKLKESYDNYFKKVYEDLKKD